MTDNKLIKFLTNYTLQIMTDAHIDRIISGALLLAVIYVTSTYSRRLFSDNNEKSSATQNNATPTQKTIWDKLKIVSIAISSIAALIYAIVKVIEIFNGGGKP